MDNALSSFGLFQVIIFEVLKVGFSFFLFGNRSPSPEPIYSNDGKRMNTREYRKRKELEEMRHEAVQKMLLINPDFKPPTDYK
jgi:hypothetical protein